MLDMLLGGSPQGLCLTGIAAIVTVLSLLLPGVAFILLICRADRGDLPAIAPRPESLLLSSARSAAVRRWRQTKGATALTGNRATLVGMADPFCHTDTFSPDALHESARDFALSDSKP